MLKIRDKRTGKVMQCTRSTWDTICDRYGKEEMFEILEGEVMVKAIATKRSVETVEVPPMPELPEHAEVKAKRKKNPNNNE